MWFTGEFAVITKDLNCLYMYSPASIRCGNLPRSDIFSKTSITAERFSRLNSLQPWLPSYTTERSSCIIIFPSYWTSYVAWQLSSENSRAGAFTPQACYSYMTVTKRCNANTRSADTKLHDLATIVLTEMVNWSQAR